MLKLKTNPKLSRWRIVAFLEPQLRSKRTVLHLRQSMVQLEIFIAKFPLFGINDKIRVYLEF